MTTLTYTGHLWVLYALAIVCTLAVFGLGVCAVLGPRQDRPEAGELPPLPPPPPLARASRFTLFQDRVDPMPRPPDDLWDTKPLILLSEHHAIIDAAGREAAAMDAAYRRKYLP